MFGTSELAVVAVLAAYMAGLALGAALAARWAPRVRRPVLVYGVLELAIALWAIGVPRAIAGLSGVYLGWLGGLDALPENLGAAAHAFHLLGAFVVLVPCTALMGATLPLLARHAVQRDDQIGPRVGLLYAVNTAGAIAGTSVAAFVLLPTLGLRQTVYVGAAVNALVFAAAALLARRAREEPLAAPPRARGLPWILPAIGVSGAVSFGYEVLWFRLFGQLLGTSTAAFSTMLASFLAGIALGSAAASRWARSPRAAARGFALAQLAIALAACAGLLAADALPDLARRLGAHLHGLAAGALLGTGLLLPLTLCIGATFPFAVRLLARDAAEASASSARVYSWNTVGSIFGAVGAGYALLPALGFPGTLLVGVGLNLVLACGAGAWLAPRRTLPIALAGLVALGLAGATTARPDRLLRSSPMGSEYEGPFRYFAVGRSATVALIDVGGSWRLTTNGLPESLIETEGTLVTTQTARWLSLLPVLLRPDTRDMLIVGLGGAITLGSVPGSVETIEVIELEPEVVAANRSIPERAGGDPLADPRVRLRLGDARGALVLTDRRYGAIVSQPSHPWTAGASHLYTREFFELVSSRLTPEGVFVQWIGPAFADLEQLRSLIAALGEAFAHVTLFQPPDGAHLMVASPAPFDPLASVARALAASPGDFASTGLHTPEDVLASLVLDAEGARGFAAGAAPNTDDFNRFAAWRAFAPARIPRDAFAAHEALPAVAGGLDTALLMRRLVENRDSALARRLATGLAPPQRELALGWLSLDAGRPNLARGYFETALAERPGWEPAATGLALSDRNTDASELPPRTRAVLDALRAVPGHSPPLDAEADALLALWRPGELLFREAVQLRVGRRLALGDPAAIGEVAEDLAVLVQRGRQPRLHLLHARVMAQSGRPERAWFDLDAIVPLLTGPRMAKLAAEMRALARSLPPPADPRIAQRVDVATAAARRR